MTLEKFAEWYENRHQYQKEWKERTGGKMIGFFCTYIPEEIYYAFDLVPVRILGSHEIQDLTKPHIFDMFCPFCRDILAQGLKGEYDYLDGITIAQSCLHLRHSFTSWELHKNPGWSYFLPMPNHVQSQRAVPFLISEYELLVKKLQDMTGKQITDSDLEKGIELMNKVRRIMQDIYEFRKNDLPPISGLESMYMCCSQFFVDAREWLIVAEEAKKEIETRNLSQDPGKRLMLIGSESDDREFINMVEQLGDNGSVRATIVVEESCLTTRYFWDQTEEKTNDPLQAIAERYVSRIPCPAKDWPQRTRLTHILSLAKEFNVDGVLILQQKYCDPHEADIPFVKQTLEANKIPVYLLELDETTPVAPLSIRVEAFLETLETNTDLFDQ